MDVTVLAILIGTPFLVGFAIGLRVEEINLKVREKALARARRTFHQEQPPPADIQPPSVPTRPL